MNKKMIIIRRLTVAVALGDVSVQAKGGCGGGGFGAGFGGGLVGGMVGGSLVNSGRPQTVVVQQPTNEASFAAELAEIREQNRLLREQNERNMRRLDRQQQRKPSKKSKRQAPVIEEDGYEDGYDQE